MATGVVTTDTVTGATPAAFLVHWQDRHDYGEIAAQEAAAFPDVLLGGGALYLTPLLGDTPYVTDAAGLAAAGEGPLLGLFADDSLPYVYDGLGDAPSLAEMTAAALEHLAADPDGFFLMVEGARIDHGSHLDDEDRVHPETAAFDAAVAVGVDWAADQDDVTLIVTASVAACRWQRPAPRARRRRHPGVGARTPTPTPRSSPWATWPRASTASGSTGSG
jgi:alkaline phosphatase